MAVKIGITLQQDASNYMLLHVADNEINRQFMFELQQAGITEYYTSLQAISKKEKRTLAQNRLLFGCVIKQIQQFKLETEGLQLSLMQIYVYLFAKFVPELGYNLEMQTVDIGMGLQNIIVTKDARGKVKKQGQIGSSDLNKQQFSQFINWICDFYAATENGGLVISMPDDLLNELEILKNNYEKD